MSETSDEMEKFANAEAEKKLNVSIKKTLKQEKKEIELLKNPNLLYEIIKEVRKEGVYGCEGSILVMINKIFLRLVRNNIPESSNVVISDKSGGGKDKMGKGVIAVVLSGKDLCYHTGFSKKALVYYGTAKEENFVWTEKVLYLEDPDEETLKSDAFRTLSSGGSSYITVDEHRLAKEISVPGKPVMIITSLRADIDTEGKRRWDGLRVDTSKSLTKIVSDGQCENFTGNNIKEKDGELRHALQNVLHSKRVVWPDAVLLKGRVGDSLIMRTQLQKFFCYMKSSAIIHQYQREKVDNTTIKANWFDYAYALFCFKKLKSNEGIGFLNIDEEEVIRKLQESKTALSITELENVISHSKQWLYTHEESLKSRGLINIVTLWDEHSGKKIRHWEPAEYLSMDSVPNQKEVLTVLTGLNETSQREGINGFNGFNNIAQLINNDREKMGLKAIIDKTVKTVKTSDILGVVKTCEDHENLQKKENDLSQQEKVKEIWGYVDKVCKVNEWVSLEALYHNCDKSTVNHLLESDLLFKNPKNPKVVRKR